MLKTHWRIFSLIERLCDNALIVLAFYLSYSFRDTLLDFSTNSWLSVSRDLPALGPIEDYYLLLAISLPVFNTTLSILGAYQSMRRHVWYRILRVSFFSAAVTFLCLGALFFILKLDLSRSFMGLFCASAAVLLFIERFLVLRLLRYFRMRGKNFRNLLIVGTGVTARKLYLEIASQAELGFNVVGFVDVRGSMNKLGQIVPETHSAVYDLQARVVATVETFERALKKHAVDEVIFTDVVNSFPVVHELSEIAVDEGVGVTFTADVFSVGIFTSEVGRLGNVPVINFISSPGGGDSIQLFIKRAMDAMISFLCLLFLSPIFILIALSIKLDTAGPIFFRQKRVGLNGRTFVLLKFRSMVNNAEDLLGGLLEDNEMEGPVFKIKNDPRVTRVGSFLRKFSLDELPQFFNVLRGDMSLVGPRPPLPSEVERYRRKQRKRLSMRPGLTCTWQVSGRNEILSFEDWAKMDLAYIENWSLIKDLRLLCRTIPVVLSGKGAS